MHQRTRQLLSSYKVGKRGYFLLHPPSMNILIDQLVLVICHIDFIIIRGVLHASPMKQIEISNLSRPAYLIHLYDGCLARMEFCVLCVKPGNCNRLRPGSFAVVGIFDLTPKTVRYCYFLLFGASMLYICAALNPIMTTCGAKFRFWTLLCSFKGADLVIYILRCRFNIIPEIERMP